MRPDDRPLFEVVIPTTDPAERRLVTADVVRTLTGLPETADAVLELLIDGISADCVRSCRLARAGSAVATFGREYLRATWLTTTCQRTSRLVLPWRAPITAVEVTEGDVELERDVDFRLLGAGVIERLSAGAASCWPGDAIVVDYTAGWLLATADASAYDGETDAVPADLVNRVVEQVKMAYDRRSMNLNLRSEDVPNTWSGSFNVAGGDAIAASGLLRPLEDALEPYRNPGAFA